MSLNRYGVLVGRALGRQREGRSDTPHYQIHIGTNDGAEYRIAINVLSQLFPSELLYVVDDDFRHPLLANLTELGEGWHPVPSTPGGAALDYIRGNLFDPGEMRVLPPEVTGPDNDLADLFEHYVQRAMADSESRLYAFGQRWGPEPGLPDKIFGFRPGNGVHDIHMNQGNEGKYVSDDGVWQDGGLLFHYPGEGRWVAVFLAFQSQSWHTDDLTGHAIEGGPAAFARAAVVRVLAAMVNPVGPAPEQEWVLLLNASPKPVDLSGWTLADRAKAKTQIPGQVSEPGETLVVQLGDGKAVLGNKGGQITLLDAAGLKVHGVSYTAADAREGWMAVF
ncbi:MAG: DUF2278 family protein [Propionibacterium sp.]|nr:DUF2278 family protein [Propionibacterium sp.]